jgi:hypothetical protein
VQLNPIGLTTELQLYPLASVPLTNFRSIPCMVIFEQGASALHCRLAIGSDKAVPIAVSNVTSSISNREELQFPATPLKVVH